MPFDAGELRGSLSWDTSEFHKAMTAAPAAAAAAGGKIAGAFDHVADVVRQSMSSVGHALQATFAGVGNAVAGVVGPEIGTVLSHVAGQATDLGGTIAHVLGEAAFNPMAAAATAAAGVTAVAGGSMVAAFSAVGVAVEQVGTRFHEMGLAAERVGVNVEWMSRLAAVAGTTGVGVEGLANGLRILEQRAEQAAEGDKSAVEGFNRLGVSAQQAAALMERPQELFDLIRERIDMKAPAERSAAAFGVLGRAGSALVPVLSMGGEGFDRLAGQMERLGGTVSETEAAMGQSLGQLRGYFGAAFAGIEKAAAKPVLGFLQAHMAEVEPKIEAATTAVVHGIGTAWGWLSDEVKQLTPTIVSVYDVVREKMVTAFAFVSQAAASAWPALKDVATTLAADFGPVVVSTGGYLASLAKAAYGVGAVVAGGLYDAFKAFKPVLAEVGHYLKDIIDWSVKALDTVGELVGMPKVYDLGPTTAIRDRLAAAKAPATQTAMNVVGATVAAAVATSAVASPMAAVAEAARQSSTPLPPTTVGRDVGQTADRAQAFAGILTSDSVRAFDLYTAAGTRADDVTVKFGRTINDVLLPALASLSGPLASVMADVGGVLSAAAGTIRVPAPAASDPTGGGQGSAPNAGGPSTVNMPVSLTVNAANRSDIMAQLNRKVDAALRKVEDQRERDISRSAGMAAFTRGTGGR